MVKDDFAEVRVPWIPVAFTLTFYQPSLQYLPIKRLNLYKKQNLYVSFDSNKCGNVAIYFSSYNLLIARSTLIATLFFTLL